MTLKIFGMTTSIVNCWKNRVPKTRGEVEGYYPLPGLPARGLKEDHLDPPVLTSKDALARQPGSLETHGALFR
jgi:hypothetical protein